MGNVPVCEENDHVDGGRSVEYKEKGYGGNAEETRNVHHLTEIVFDDVGYGGEYDFVDRVWHWTDEPLMSFRKLDGI